MLPDRGDIRGVVLDPVLGTEQAGRRPTLVLSSRVYHEGSPRALICPITPTMRDWAFSVRLPAGLKTSGMVRVHQVRAIDRRSRLLDKIDSVPQEFVAEVQGRLAALCGIEDFEKQ